MKKLLSLAVILGMFFVSMAGVAQAATATDTFQIIITVSFIEIDLRDRTDAPNSYLLWDIGTVDGGVATTMASNSGGVGELGVKVETGSTNVALDLSVFATNTAPWTLNPALPVGQNECLLEVKPFTTPIPGWQAAPFPDMATGTTIITNTVAPGHSIVDELPAGSDCCLYFRLTAPTTVNPISMASTTFTVTVRAIND